VKIIKIIVQITLELTKPDVVGSDFDAIKGWIKTNVIDKLPPEASATYHVTITS